MCAGVGMRFPAFPAHVERSPQIVRGAWPQPPVSWLCPSNMQAALRTRGLGGPELRVGQLEQVRKGGAKVRACGGRVGQAGRQGKGLGAVCPRVLATLAPCHFKCAIANNRSSPHRDAGPGGAACRQPLLEATRSGCNHLHGAHGIGGRVHTQALPSPSRLPWYLERG